MNRQEIYNRVKAHLLAQGKRAIRPENETCLCLYRAPGGLKCAIGCLILDEFYSEELENKIMSDYIVQRALEKSGVKIKDENDEEFLTQLQQIHDVWPERDWASRLANHAANYGLNP